MKKFKVTVKVFKDNAKSEEKAIIVEAGNRKLAHIRAMQKLSQDGYSDWYKTLVSIVEIY